LLFEPAALSLCFEIVANERAREYRSFFAVGPVTEDINAISRACRANFRTLDLVNTAAVSPRSSWRAFRILARGRVSNPSSRTDVSGMVIRAICPPTTSTFVDGQSMVISRSQYRREL
jgi:hypothetical protein